MPKTGQKSSYYTQAPIQQSETDKISNIELTTTVTESCIILTSFALPSLISNETYCLIDRKLMWRIVVELSNDISIASINCFTRLLIRSLQRRNVVVPHYFQKKQRYSHAFYFEVYFSMQ